MRRITLVALAVAVGIILGSIAVAILIALAPPGQGTQHAKVTVWPYRHYKAPTKDRVCVRVEWIQNEEDAPKGPCKGGSACWLKSSSGDCDLIIAPIPRDFNDERRLLILGHEVLHALGAEHD